jgi:Bifunctional DNA primase/polymerase, N-terminal
MSKGHNRSRNHITALTFAAAGVRVFPCDLEKRPLVKDWLNASTTDPSKIDEWWSQNPDALVALPMKHLDCVVVDADRHDPSKDGVALFNAMIAENSPLPSHPKIDTANNDEHHIFRQPPDNKIGNKVVTPGLETRGYKVGNDGGYIIAVNSVMPDGRGWKLAAGSPSFLQSLKAKTIPQPPDWLIEKLNGQPKGQHLPDTADRAECKPNGRGDHGGRGAAYAEAALDNVAAELAGVAKGNRNNALNTAALKLASMVARDWIAKTAVVDALYASCIKNGLVTDDGADAVQKTLASGFKAGLENPHADLKDRPPDGGGHKQTTTAKPNGGEVPKPTNKTLVVTRASDIEPVPVEWLWPGRLAKGKTTLLGPASARVSCRYSLPRPSARVANGHARREPRLRKA